MPARSPCCVAQSTGAVSASDIDTSCRWPLLALYGGAAVWLLVSAVAALLASLSFHAPAMFADCEYSSYGRMAPVAKRRGVVVVIEPLYEMIRRLERETGGTR